jgi:hypothetical protein
LAKVVCGAFDASTIEVVAEAYAKAREHRMAFAEFEMAYVQLTLKY